MKSQDNATCGVCDSGAILGHMFVYCTAISACANCASSLVLDRHSEFTDAHSGVELDRIRAARLGFEVMIRHSTLRTLRLVVREEKSASSDSLSTRLNSTREDTMVGGDDVIDVSSAIVTSIVASVSHASSYI